MNITKLRILVSNKWALAKSLVIVFFSISEAQEQVTANLANFAYDPINWQYLKDGAAIELFLELLSSQNPRLVLHGTAALCNIIPGSSPNG